MNKENNAYSKKKIVSFSEHFFGVVKDLAPLVLLAIPFGFGMILIVYMFFGFVVKIL